MKGAKPLTHQEQIILRYFYEEGVRKEELDKINRYATK